jgi:TP901 family phage tail tape measure protein
MADGIELAQAYVTLIPSLDGVQGKIKQEFGDAAEDAAEEAGHKSGTKFSTKFGLAIAGLTVAIGKGLFEVGETFDDMVDTIRVGTGATGDALQGLEDVALSIGGKVPAKWEDIGTTVAGLNTRLGLTGDELETVASQFLEAGRMGQQLDINNLTAAFSAFGVEGDSVSGAMDQLFRVSQATGVGMDQLASLIGKQAPALQNLGFGFEESAAMAGILDKAGIDAGSTLGAMGKGLVTLAKDGEEPQEAFRRITGEINDLIKSGDVAGALDLASGIFGTKAANSFVGAVQSGSLALDDLVGAAGISGDTILGLGADTMDFAEQFDLLKNNAALALEPLGSAVFGTLSGILKDMMPTIQAITGWLKEHPTVLKILVGVIGAVAVALGIAAAAQWVMNAAFLANPITWIIVGIVALIAAIALLVSNWDTVVAWLKDIWGAIVDWVVGTFEWIRDKASAIFTAIADFFVGLWQGIVDFATGVWNGIRDFFVNLWGGIKDTAVNVWNGVVDFITGIPGRVMDGLRALANLGLKAAEWFLGVLNAGKEKLLELVEWVKGIPGRVVSALGDLGSKLFNSGKALIQGFIDGIGHMVQKVKDAASNILQKVRDFFPFSPAKLGPFSGKGYVTYSAKALAGDFADTLAGQAKVARAGAEKLMAGAADATPASLATANNHPYGGTVGGAQAGGFDMAAGVGGLVVNGPLVQVQTMVVDSKERARDMAQALYQRGADRARALGKVNLAGVTE